MLDPQPQMQPLNPVEGRPFAEPQQPLDLRPKPTRQPLDVRPAPRQPLDLRPRPSARPGAGASPGDLLDYQRSNPFSVVEPVINNPLGYAPGKALTLPLTFVEHTRKLHQDLTVATPLETIDVPSVPLPSDSFPDLAESPTSPLPRDAIGDGPLQSEGGDTSASYGPSSQPIQGGTPGVTYKVVLYDVRASVETPLFIGYVTGSYTISWDISGFNATPLLIGMNSTGFTRAPGYPFGYVQAQDIGNVASQAQAQNDATPQRSPNPARSSWPSGIPDFLDLPDNLDMPGIQPEIPLLPAPAPTGEIVPYVGEPYTPPEREPYTPPEREPYTAPATIPDFEPNAGENPNDVDEPGKLGPPWWDVWEDWDFPDPWTNKKRGNRGEAPDQLPGTPPVTTSGPIAVVPYDGCCIETQAKLREIINRLKKLEVDSDIPTVVCDETTDPPSPRREAQAAKDLKTAINLIGQSLVTIREQFPVCIPAPLEQSEHIELAKETATEAQTVWYVPLPPETCQVELIITGELPKSFRLYDTSANGEQQAKFGAITLSYPGVTGGNTADAFHQWLWTRRTTLYVKNKLPRPASLRVFVRAGLSWVLYDTGVRE